MNKDILNRVAEKCYFPANKIILEEIERFKGTGKEFKVSFSLSGVFIEQCRMWRPEILESFSQLVETGCVELLGQTYYHSLSSLYPDWSEFMAEVEMHREAMRELFNYSPSVFENTECLYNNSIAKAIERVGYEATITEGLRRFLGWRSPNYVYRAKGSSVRVLLRNYQLSDDIGFRFASTEWDQWPLTADKYADWLSSTPGQVIVIFMDYETFGEHYWRESGILDFLRWLPREVNRRDNLTWSTPSEAISRHPPVDEIDIPRHQTVSWADEERDMTAWLGNTLQKTAFNLLREVRTFVNIVGDEQLLRVWRYLQTSDHFYYMSTKGGGSGVVHSTFNPYGNPVEAFITFTRILSDLEARCRLESKEFRYEHRFLRRLPPERAFSFFHKFAGPTGLVAHSLEEFHSVMKTVSIDSIRFHLERGDFERWLGQVVGDEELAEEFRQLSEEELPDGELRKRVLDLLHRRIEELKNMDGDFPT